MLVLLPETVAAARARRARESPADQHESRGRVGAGQHRPDDPGRGRVAAVAFDMPLVLGPGAEGSGDARRHVRW